MISRSLLVAILCLLFISTLAAQTAPPTRPSENTSEKRGFQVSNWFQAGMMLEILEITPTLRYFDPETAAIMLPREWAAERKQLERLGELKEIELSSFDSVKPEERVIGETKTTSKSGTVTKTTVYAGTMSPERKAPPESIAIGQALMSSIQGRLGAEPLNLWHFNLGRNTQLVLFNADSRVDSVRLKGVETFRLFMKTAPPGIDKEAIDIAEEMAALITKGIFTSQDTLKFSELMSKLDSLMGMQPAIPDTVKKKP